MWAFRTQPPRAVPPQRLSQLCPASVSPAWRGRGRSAPTPAGRGFCASLPSRREPGSARSRPAWQTGLEVLPGCAGGLAQTFPPSPAGGWHLQGLGDVVAARRAGTPGQVWWHRSRRTPGVSGSWGGGAGGAVPPRSALPAPDHTQLEHEPFSFGTALQRGHAWLC